MSRDAYDFKSDESRLCTDCRWCRWETRTCRSPGAAGPASPVDGAAAEPDCFAAREPGGACGPGGAMFELRPGR